MRRLFATAMLLLVVGCATPTATQTPDIPTASDLTDVDKLARVRMELASAYFSRGQTETALDEVKQHATIITACHSRSAIADLIRILALPGQGS